MKCIYSTPLVDVSIRLTPLFGIVLNASIKVYIHFDVLFCFKIRICCCFTMRNHEVLFRLCGDLTIENPWGELRLDNAIY